MFLDKLYHSGSNTPEEDKKTFENRTLKDPLSHFRNKGVVLPLHLNVKHRKRKKERKKEVDLWDL